MIKYILLFYRLIKKWNVEHFKKQSDWKITMIISSELQIIVGCLDDIIITYIHILIFHVPQWRALVCRKTNQLNSFPTRICLILPIYKSVAMHARWIKRHATCKEITISKCIYVYSSNQFECISWNENDDLADEKWDNSMHFFLDFFLCYYIFITVFRQMSNLSS